MGKLLDLAHTPPRYERIVPDPHRLIVFDHPDDGMDVEHPDSCKREHFTWPSGDPGVGYLCPVEFHLDACGTDYLYRHAFEEEAHHHEHRIPLLPGTYTFHFAVTFWYSSRLSMFDDSDPDEEVEVVPQAALPSAMDSPLTCLGGEE